MVAASDGESAALDASPEGGAPAAQVQAEAGAAIDAGRVAPEASVPIDASVDAGEPLSDASGGSQEPVDASALAKAMGFGANIGNTLENTITWETGWGQPLITQSFLRGMASRGIKTVRVPVAWDTYANNGVIDASKLNRVKEVVGWIEAAGMYAIVNIHWDGGWIFNENKAGQYRLSEDVKTKFANYWKQIAAGFGGVGHMLILEGLNEEGRFYLNGDPMGMPDMEALNQLNQLFVTTVRAQGGYNATRPLLIAGFNTDINSTCVDAFAVPMDPAGAGRLFLSIHYYDPYTFTLMEEPASWGSPVARWGSDAEKQALEAQFIKLGTCSTSKKIPVILGEFAVTRGQNVMRESASRVSWMQSVAKAALSRGIVPVLWDTGTDINRGDGSFSSELQAVMNAL
jgi:endoglucanase